MWNKKKTPQKTSVPPSTPQRVFFFNSLLHALELLILQCSEVDHVLVVQLKIMYLQLQPVATQVPLQHLNNKEATTVGRRLRLIKLLFESEPKLEETKRV